MFKKIPWNKGKNHTKKTCKKISLSRLNQSPWNKGKKLPQYSGKNAGHWKGGRRKHDSGYILIYQPTHPFSINHRYIYEHRFVIEQQLGRYLTSKETAHHLGEKNDNRLKMLMLFKNHSAHKRFHSNPTNVKPSEIIFDGRYWFEKVEA